MWAFFSRRARLWVATVFVAPLASLVLGRLGTALERRNGPSTVTRALQSGSRFLGRRKAKAQARSRRR